jgi:hypothetical protein
LLFGNIVSWAFTSVEWRVFPFWFSYALVMSFPSKWTYETLLKYSSQISPRRFQATTSCHLV